MGWVGRLAVATCVAILVYIFAAWLIGPALLLMGVPLATLVGDFIIRAALVLSICAFIFALFSGATITWPPSWWPRVQSPPPKQ